MLEQDKIVTGMSVMIADCSAFREQGLLQGNKVVGHIAKLSGREPYNIVFVRWSHTGLILDYRLSDLIPVVMSNEEALSLLPSEEEC